MGKNYTAAYRRLKQLENWDGIAELYDEILAGAGLTTEQVEKAAADFGHQIAEAMHARDKGGRKI